MVGNKAQKAVAAALTGMLALGSVAPALAASTLDNGWIRLDGSYNQSWKTTNAGTMVANSGTVDGVDRYDTMLDAFAYNTEVSNNWKGANKVVLVSGTSYSDALAAAGLAGWLDGPIITTPSDSLGWQAKAIIENLVDANGKVTVYIVGGTSAVSKSVADDVADIADVSVIRIAGDTRVDTSTKVMEYLNEGLKAKDDNVWKNGIYVANGWAWADALSVSSFAYRSGSPIVLTNADGSLSEDQLDYLKDQLDNGVNVSVIGGPAQLAYDTLDALDKKVGGLYYIAGEDRYDTSALVVEQEDMQFSVSGTKISFTDLAVATGKNFPDALVGGAFVGERSGVLVLVGEQGVDKNWNKAVKEAAKAWHISDKFILGGEKAVSKGVANALVDLV